MTKYQDSIKEERERQEQAKADRAQKRQAEHPGGIFPPREPGATDEQYSASIATELERVNGSAQVGKRRASREAFSRAMRKLVRREDKAAEDKGLATEAVLIVATVDPSKEGQPILISVEMLRSTDSDIGTIAIMQAAGEIIARTLAEQAGT